MQTLESKIVTREGALAELCKRSFYRFLREFIDIIEPSAPNFVWNWHIAFLCEETQKVVFAYMQNQPTYHINANICPGATKSTIFSRALTAWIWTVFPEATTINVSRDSNNVKEFALKSKEIIKSEKYRLLFPEVEIKSEPDSMFYFENTKNGRRYGLTTKSTGSTGKHADFIIFDDIYSYIDLETPTSLKSLELSIEGYLSRFKDKEKGVVINVMQRLGMRDATSFLFTGYQETKPKLSNFKNICLPAVLNDKVQPEDVREKYIDGLLDPIRLNNNILEKEKIKYGYRYDAQFGQKPFLNKDGLMYPELRMFDHELPSGADYSFTDVADTGDDYLCTWFVRVAKSGIFVYDAIYTKDGSGITIPRMSKKMNLYKCVLNWIEANNQGSVFISQLSKTVPNIDGKFETSNKITRLFSYSHLVSFIQFKSTGSTEYLKAIEDVRHLPKEIKNNGKDMDIDAADALTAMMRYFYYNFQHYFLIK